jgi:uncharacterized protein (DUF2249 family)
MSALATTTATPAVIDLRMLAPRERHARVFGLVDALPMGESLQLLNDHDPQPLKFQLEDRAIGQFEWTALESGPAVWRLQITRVGAQAKPVGADACCSGGGCCG